MPIQLYDSLERKLKPLAPTQPDGVYRFYNCGPTVYAPAHIGNFRTFVVNDVVRRLLELEFGADKVKHVRNLTDVDDKTIKRAQDEKRSLADVTKQWTDKFHADCDALNCLRPHVEPTATGHIKEQVDMIDVLMKKGNAYRAADGSVYFKVSSFDGYGKLSRVKERELQVQPGSALKSQAVDADEKEDATDFALWKAHKADDGANSWDSPWGAGRPGWHIECSAMSKKHLGETIDLHTGGVDLLFPHHENEIAQSECCNGTQFAKHWYHSEHLLVDGKKMSKSLGNLYTLDDLKAKGVSPMALRYALLMGHPRKQLNFTLDSLHAAESALHTLRAYRSSLPATTTGAHDTFGHVITALHDDLNTPGAFGALFTVVNRKGGEADQASFDRALFALGLDLAINDLPKAETPAEITVLAEDRWAAKKAKDFSTADAIRKRLMFAGWNMKDSKDGYKLEPITSPARPMGDHQFPIEVPLVPTSSKTFRIRLSEVPEAIKNEVQTTTGDYTVPIIINDELVGSGTLVKISGRYGVLTAEHVINHPTKPNLRLETSSAHGPKLLLPPANFPGGIPVDAAALQIISTKRGTNEFGPDLALVILPPCPLLDSLKARKSFYPLGGSPTRDTDNAISETGFASFCGFPAERIKSQTPTLGYNNVVETPGYAFLTGIERYERSGDWDYFELGVSREELGDFIESFGGVSGGGLWRFQVNRSANSKEGSETLGLLTLGGVAFYEEEDSKKRKFFIRAHGAHSIYTTFLKQIRSALGADPV